MMVKQSKPQYEKPDPLSKVVLKFFWRIIAYPHVIIKKYQSYNIRVAEMRNELKKEEQSHELERLLANNGKLILLFIYVPILLGIVCSGLSINSHKYDYQSYWRRLHTVERADGITDSIGNKWKKVKFAVAENPVKKYDFLLVMYGYMIAIMGARFLSINPIFKEEAKITEIFASLGMIDSQGNPWTVTWTPDAIQIDSFNCDPLALCSNLRFWSTINFPPSPPKINKIHRRKFIVVRAYELSPTMLFSFD
jgi:hypothetical protein